MMKVCPVCSLGKLCPRAIFLILCGYLLPGLASAATVLSIHPASASPGDIVTVVGLDFLGHAEDYAVVVAGDAQATTLEVLSLTTRVDGLQELRVRVGAVDLPLSGRILILDGDHVVRTEHHLDGVRIRARETTADTGCEVAPHYLELAPGDSDERVVSAVRQGGKLVLPPPAGCFARVVFSDVVDPPPCDGAPRKLTTVTIEADCQIVSPSNLLPIYRDALSLGLGLEEVSVEGDLLFIRPETALDETSLQMRVPAQDPILP